MTEEIDVLKLVCHKLESAGFLYMLTGSLAANFYAIPRMTRDIDVVVEILKPDVDRFVQYFQNDFYISKEAISDSIKHKSMFNVIHNRSAFKVDFIVRKDTSYRTTEFQRRRRVALDGEPIWIVSPEDLIISKLFWAKDSLSELQIKDVKNLLASIKNLDLQYIHDWVQALDLHIVYEKMKAHG